MGLYLDVFVEAAWSASIIPYASEATLVAMKSFGGHDMVPAALLAIIGGTLGLFCNFLIGKAILPVYLKSRTAKTDYWYNRLAVLFNKYGVFLLIFSWVSILKLLVVLAGVLNTRARFVLPLIILGQIIHYGSYLF